jgi:hypothetical protein
MRDDISLEYRNYLSQDSVPKSIVSLFYEIKCDSFDVDFLKKTKLLQLKGETYDYFFQKEHFFRYEFEKDKSIYGDYHDHSFKLPTLDLGEIYIAGKINYHNGVEGLIVIFKSSKKAMFADGVECFDIKVFVIRNEKLCSIFKLSTFTIKNNKNANYIRTYKTNKECYTQIDFYGLTNIQSPNVCEDCDNWSNVKSWADIKRKLGLETKIKRLRYTMFYVDEIGFVRYISSVGAEESQLPKILTQKSNWATINFVGGMLM